MRLEDCAITVSIGNGFIILPLTHITGEERNGTEIWANFEYGDVELVHNIVRDVEFGYVFSMRLHKCPGRLSPCAKGNTSKGFQPVGFQI